MPHAFAIATLPGEGLQIDDPEAARPTLELDAPTAAGTGFALSVPAGADRDGILTVATRGSYTATIDGGVIGQLVVA